jgi:DNA-binding LacI/PurR family transcriptional regulator
MEFITKAKPSPLYKQIKDQLNAYIVEQNLAPDTLLPDLKTIAKMANVSVRTAFIAVDELVKEGICYKKANRGVFVSSTADSAESKKNALAIWLPGQSHDFLEDNRYGAAIHNGLLSYTSKNSIDVLFFTGDLESDLKFYTSLTNLRLHGVILYTHTDLKMLTEIALRFPNMGFELINQHYEDFTLLPENIFGIVNDDFHGAYQITDMLVKQGRKRFCFINNRTHGVNYDLREQGFRKALTDNGVEFDNHNRVQGNTSSREEMITVGVSFAASLLEKANPDAIVCVNDYLASGVALKLRREGLSEEIAVSGHDNYPAHLSRELDFPTVHIDYERMGLLAAMRFFDKEHYYAKSISLPPKVIVHDSVKTMESIAAGILL